MTRLGTWNEQLNFIVHFHWLKTEYNYRHNTTMFCIFDWNWLIVFFKYHGQCLILVNGNCSQEFLKQIWYPRNTLSIILRVTMDLNLKVIRAKVLYWNGFLILILILILIKDVCSWGVIALHNISLYIACEPPVHFCASFGDMVSSSDSRSPKMLLSILLYFWF